MPDGFTSSIEELEDTAGARLPALRGTISDVRRIVESTADVQDSAFGGDLFAGLADDWENLRLLVQRTQQNLVGDLETCSTVLQEIADRYREADTFHFADEAEVISDDGRASG